MNVHNIANQLQEEWELESGSLGRLRDGFLDQEGLERVKDLIKSLEIFDLETIDKQLISLIWFIPMFMEMQKERVQERGYDIHILQYYQHQILSSLLNILGP